MCSQDFRPVRQPWLVRWMFVALTGSRHPLGRLVYMALLVAALCAVLVWAIAARVEAEAIPGRFTGTSTLIRGVEGGRYIELRDTAWVEGQCYGLLIIPEMSETWRLGPIPCPPTAEERARYRSSLRVARPNR